MLQMFFILNIGHFNTDALIHLKRWYFYIFLCVSVLGECSTKNVQILGLCGNDGSGKTLSLSLLFLANVTCCSHLWTFFFFVSGSSGLVCESLPQRELWQRRCVDLAHHRPAHCCVDVFPWLLRPTLRRDDVEKPQASSSFHTVVCKPNECQTEVIGINSRKWAFAFLILT